MLWLVVLPARQLRENDRVDKSVGEHRSSTIYVLTQKLRGSSPLWYDYTRGDNNLYIFWFCNSEIYAIYEPWQSSKESCKLNILMKFDVSSCKTVLLKIIDIHDFAKYHWLLWSHWNIYRLFVLPFTSSFLIKATERGEVWNPFLLSLPSLFAFLTIQCVLIFLNFSHLLICVLPVTTSFVVLCELLSMVFFLSLIDSRARKSVDVAWKKCIRIRERSETSQSRHCTLSIMYSGVVCVHARSDRCSLDLRK